MGIRIQKLTNTVILMSGLLLTACGGFEADSAALRERAQVLSQTRIFSAATAVNTGGASGSLSSSGLGSGAAGSLASGSNNKGPAGGSLTNNGVQTRIPSQAPLRLPSATPAPTPIPQTNASSQLSQASLPTPTPAPVPPVNIWETCPQCYLPEVNHNEGQVPLQLTCSTMDGGGRLVHAQNIVVKLRRGDSVICTTVMSQLKEQILQTKILELNSVFESLKASCPELSNSLNELESLPAESLQMTFESDDALRKSNIANFAAAAMAENYSLNQTNLHTGFFQVKVVGARLLLQEPRFFNFNFDFNPEFNPVHGDRVRPDIECTGGLSSPLVIQMNANLANPEPLELTSQIEGIVFDILGKNAKPAPHTPKRISWHRSLDYFFVTLPNAKGQVNGVDELFGDNTSGPDGHFATDGFHALAKWDGMSADGRVQVIRRDGKIDANDPIYRRLRLWRDSNFDGIAQPNELIPLATAGVESIDLMYDPHYFEKDIHGNEIRYKSIVKMKSGKMNLVFDLWFAHRDIQLR